MNVVSVKQVLIRTRLPEGLTGGQEDKAFMVDKLGFQRIEVCEFDTLILDSNSNGSIKVLDPGKRNPDDTNHMQVLVLNPFMCLCRQIDLDTGAEINFQGSARNMVFLDWLRLYFDNLRIYDVANDLEGGSEVCVVDNFKLPQTLFSAVL